MSKIKLASLSEIPEGEMIEKSHQDRQILLANVGGTIYAMNNVCTHQGAPLNEGELGAHDDNPHLLTCPWHEAHFDVRSGKVHQETPWAVDTEVYEVTVDDGEVYVEI